MSGARGCSSVVAVVSFTNSSIVVMPLSTFFIPSSRRVNIPSEHAKSRSSSVDTSRMIILRSSVDMIMSNWQMEPVDGTMLLKWVRRHRESLDRFIPFIMVSGYGDSERVAEARDLGANEFIAKPYSVGQLLTRLMMVVSSPRQFVLLDTFFGPDRRRRTSAPPGKNRRVMPEKDIEIIHDDS